MRLIGRLVSLLLTIFAFVSCVTQKQMTYFREVDSSTADSVNKVFESQIDPVIKAGDALAITVSALDMEAVVPYNLPTVVFSNPGTDQLTTTPSQQYYTVDAAGKIEFPVLGSVSVLGLKTTEVADLLEEKLSAQVKDPMVLVRLINAKVTVIVEVILPV